MNWFFEFLYSAFQNNVGCNWTPYSNSNTPGGVQQSGLNSQMACQLDVITLPMAPVKVTNGCLINSPGSQCYFFPTNAPPTNMGTAPGVNHYTWDCSSEYWFVMSNSILKFMNIIGAEISMDKFGMHMTKWLFIDWSQALVGNSNNIPFWFWSRRLSWAALHLY